MKKPIKKAQTGVSKVTRFTSKRSDSYPIEKKVEYDTAGYSAGKKMFPAKFTDTYSSGKIKTTTGSGDRSSVDKAIKNPIVYEGQKTQYTKAPAKGSDIRKYMNAGTNPKTGLGSPVMKGPVKPGSRSAASVTQQKSNDAYYSKLANPTGKKASTPAKAKAKVVRTATPAITAPKREMPSGISKPSVPGIQSKPEGRQYTPAEIKAMTALKKGTKKDGTVRAGAAGKAKTIMRRADAINKRAAVKEAKANVRAVKRSYKK